MDRWNAPAPSPDAGPAGAAQPGPRTAESETHTDHIISRTGLIKSTISSQASEDPELT